MLKFCTLDQTKFIISNVVFISGTVMIVWIVENKNYSAF